MGRPKTIHKDLPPRMTARPSRDGWRYYYTTRAGGKIPLGRDKAAALARWAEIEAGHIDRPDNFASVARAWLASLGHLAVKTQHEYRLAVDHLLPAFGAAHIGQIQPRHVRQYLDQRSAKVAANREVAALSAIYNHARERGITDRPNPCAGVRRNRERPRETYVSEAMFRAVWEASALELRDALDLARLTGQREADILAMRRDHIADGHLWVRQGKTGRRLGIEISGELAEVVERCLTRPRRATGTWLVQTDVGQRLTYAMLRRRFAAARKASGQDWQFRDLRPKAATDLDDIRHAQQLLGHASETTTAAIYRRRRGDKVKPAGRS
jgi:integrase